MKAILTLAALMLLSGCQGEKKPSLLPPERLRRALPDVRIPFTATEFRARPGLVNHHLHKNNKLVGMMVIEDLLDDPERRKLFDNAPERIQNCPAMTTSMGGGLALLHADRVKAEVIALTPDIPEAQLRRWLEEFHLDVLKDTP